MQAGLSWQEDGSIEDTEGRVIYFRCDRFIRDVVHGDCCFICGASPKAKTFNDEHIIPDWILREFNLHSRWLTLPNQGTLMYGRYTVPCCQECNTTLGATYEKPVQELLSKGHDEVAKHLENHGPWLIFCWLALIFLKTHLRDRNLRADVDRRVTSPTIGEAYDYADLHHIHCRIRAPFTGVVLQPEVLGSFLTIAARFGDEIKEEEFDYGDTLASRTVMLRYHGTAFVAALDDSVGALTLFGKTFERITAAVFPAQLREIHAHIAFLSANLKERPKFQSDFSGTKYTIRALRPSVVGHKDPPAPTLGEFLLLSCGPMLENHPDQAQVRQSLREGRWSFLFDADAKLIVEGYRKLADPY